MSRTAKGVGMPEEDKNPEHPPMQHTLAFYISEFFLICLGAVTAYNTRDFIIMVFFIFCAAVGIILITVPFIKGL